MKHIKLKFQDRSIIILSGRLFGKEVFNEQIAPEIKDEKEIVLEFPPQIRSFASSFPNGLLSSEVEKLGLENVKKKYTIFSEIDGVEEDFWESF